jgi:hypothetical protein
MVVGQRCESTPQKGKEDAGSGGYEQRNSYLLLSFCVLCE